MWRSRQRPPTRWRRSCRRWRAPTRSWRSSTAPGPPPSADRGRLDGGFPVPLVDGEAHALAVVPGHQLGAVLPQLGHELLERDAFRRLAELDLQLAELVVGLPPVRLVRVGILRCRRGRAGRPPLARRVPPGGGAGREWPASPARDRAGRGGGG